MQNVYFLFMYNFHFIMGVKYIHYHFVNTIWFIFLMLDEQTLCKISVSRKHPLHTYYDKNF